MPFFIGTWYNTKANLSDARQFSGGACGDADEAICVGGYDPAGTGYKTLCEVFDGVSWASTASLSSARMGAVFGGRFGCVLAGGASSGTIHNGCEEYNGNDWTSTDPLINNSLDNAVTGSLFAGLNCGGRGPTWSDLWDDTEEYNGTVWTSDGNMLEALANHCMTGTQTDAVIAGGNSAATTKVDTVREYNGTAWASGSVLPQTRSAMSAARASGYDMFCFDGDDDVSPLFSPANYYYDKTAWSLGPYLPVMGYRSAGVGNSGASTSGALRVGGSGSTGAGVFSQTMALTREVHNRNGSIVKATSVVDISGGSADFNFSEASAGDTLLVMFVKDGPSQPTMTGFSVRTTVGVFLDSVLTVMEKSSASGTETDVNLVTGGEEVAAMSFIASQVGASKVATTQQDSTTTSDPESSTPAAGFNDANLFAIGFDQEGANDDLLYRAHSYPSKQIVSLGGLGIDPQKLHIGAGIITSQGVWTAGPSIPAEHYYAATFGEASAATMVGGSVQGAIRTDATTQYNGTSWSAGGTYPYVIRQLSATGSGTSGIANAGNTSGGYINNAAEYNGTVWSTANGSFYNKSLHITVGVETAALTVGGDFSSGNIVSNSEEYNGISWTTTSSNLTPRKSGNGMGASDDAIFVGGSTSTETETGFCERYDGNNWNSASPALAAHDSLSDSGSSLSDGLARGLVNIVDSYTTWTDKAFEYDGFDDVWFGHSETDIVTSVGRGLTGNSVTATICGGSSNLQCIEWDSGSPGTPNWSLNSAIHLALPVTSYHWGTLGISYPAAGDPVAYVPSIYPLDGDGEVGVTFFKDYAQEFVGTQTPFSYSLSAGTMPPGLSFSGTPFLGRIFGSPTQHGVYSGLVIRATDQGANTADTAPFTLTITQVVTFLGGLGNQIVQLDASSDLDIASYFDGSYTPFTYSLSAGTLPSGLTLDTVTGHITGIADTVETQAGIVVRATDTSGLPIAFADTDPFSIEVADDVLAQEVPSEGQDGPAFAYPHLVFPEDTDKVVTYTMIQNPAAGTFTPYPDTSFTFVAPDGNYSFQFDLYLDGQYRGRFWKDIKVGP